MNERNDYKNVAGGTFEYKVKKLARRITYQMRGEAFEWFCENATEEELDNDPTDLIRKFILSFGDEDKIKIRKKYAGDL